MKVAVVGGGVSGLSATWALNEHSDHTVHLYEANEYVGGHTNTVLFTKPGDSTQEVMVDTGFIVFNRVTYPNFLNFLQHLKIDILESDMSFSVTRTAPMSRPQTKTPFSLVGAFPSLPLGPDVKAGGPERGEFEWAGATPVSLFCQWSNLFSPSHWRMVWDIIRFNHQSIDSLDHFDRKAKDPKDVRASRFAQQSIGEWLAERNYSHSFVHNYLVPMTACIWSTPADKTVSEFPALTLLRFMHNHHLLQILDRPQWLTLKGGSKNYVDRILSKLPPKQLHKGKAAGRVVEATYDRKDGQWLLSTADGHVESFDKIIFAGHADNTVRILAGQFEADEEGKQLHRCLSQFEFNHNTALLHADTKLMPVRRSAWSAWNFITESKDGQRDEDGVVLTYWMNLLQSIDEQRYGPVLVTLNAPENFTDPDKTLQRFSYQHPVYTAKSVAAQKELRSWQGRWNGAHFAGAWTNYGFHEDGFSSGLRAAHALGATPPFPIRDAERTTAVQHTFRVTNGTIQLLDKMRGQLAPLVLFVLAPLAIVLSLLLEAVTNSVTYALKGSNTRSATRNELRRIRAGWEPFLHPTLMDLLSQPTHKGTLTNGRTANGRKNV